MKVGRLARVGAAVVTLFGLGAVVSPLGARTPESGAVMPAALASPPSRFVLQMQPDGSMKPAMPAVRVDDLLAQVDIAAGPAAALDATRAVIAQRYGVRLPDMHPASSLSPMRSNAASQVAASEVEAAPAGVRLHTSGASPAGDLNGDGSDDVLLYAVGDESTMRAVSGADGSTLWSRPAGDWIDIASLATVDMSGDGVPDLLSVSVTEREGQHVERGCAEGPCRVTNHFEFTTTYGVISGRDGTDVWSEQVDGWSEIQQWDRRSRGLASRSRDRGARWIWQNSVVFFDVAGDHDGDGVADAVVNVLSSRQEDGVRSSTSTVVMSEDTYYSSETNATDASVRSGATGAVLVEKSSPESPTFAVLQPAPQLVGDRTPDLVWVAEDAYDVELRCRSIDAIVVSENRECEDDVEGAGQDSEVTAVDGATLEDAWTFRRPFGAPAVEVAPDVSGDGVADLALHRDGELFRTTFLSGATGAEMWTVDAAVLVVGDDVTGSGRPGVLSVSWGSPNADQGGWEFDVHRHDGATGATVSTSNMSVVTGVEDATSVWVGIDVAALGGSPARDVLAQVAAARMHDDSDMVEEQATAVVVEEGRGGRLAERRIDEFRVAHPFADLDVDGAVDGIEFTATFLYIGPPGNGLVLTRWSQPRLRRIVDDALLWPVPDATSAVPVGDQDGVPGPDVVLVRWVSEEGDADGDGYTDYHYDVTSASGRTGTPRWTITVR